MGHFIATVLGTCNRYDITLLADTKSVNFGELRGYIGKAQEELL